MNSESLTISGLTLTPNEQGATVKYGFLSQQASTADLIKLRDWLNLTFPAEPIQSLMAGR
jgi:hypothetical protein